MNRLRSPNLRRNAVAIAAGIVGAAGLAGCDVLSNKPAPLKPETQARLARILRPAGHKMGAQILSFSRKHPIESDIFADDSTPGGYTIEIDGIQQGSFTEISASMKKTLDKKTGKLTLNPNTTYDVRFDADDNLGKGVKTDYDDEIRNTERPDYSRRVWFASGFYDRTVKGKDVETVGADTHIDNPKDALEVQLALEYASDEAGDTADELSASLQELAESFNQ